LTASFFFGARAGFVRSAEAPGPAISPAAESASPPAAAESLRPLPPAARPAPPPKNAAAPGLGPSGPETISTFEDREAGVPDEAAAPTSSEMGKSAPSRTEIAEPSKSRPTTTLSATAEEGQFFVQVLSTPSRLEAERWKKRLAAAKYRAVVSVVQTAGRRLFRVRLGPYPDRERARRAAEKISDDFHRQAWVAPAE